MATLKRAKRIKARSKATYILTAPKGAFTPERITELKSEFKAAGVNVIWLLYNNNSPAKPQFDKI